MSTYDEPTLSLALYDAVYTSDVYCSSLLYTQ